MFSIGGGDSLAYLMADPIFGPILAILIVLAIGVGVALFWAIVVPGIWYILTGQVAVNVARGRQIRYKVVRRETPPWKKLFSKARSAQRQDISSSQTKSKGIADREKYVRIRTRFGGTCVVCRRRIELGDTVYWAKGTEIICPQCYERL